MPAVGGQIGLHVGACAEAGAQPARGPPPTVAIASIRESEPMCFGAPEHRKIWVSVAQVVFIVLMAVARCMAETTRKPADLCAPWRSERGCKTTAGGRRPWRRARARLGSEFFLHAEAMPLGSTVCVLVLYHGTKSERP